MGLLPGVACNRETPPAPPSVPAADAASPTSAPPETRRDVEVEPAPSVTVVRSDAGGGAWSVQTVLQPPPSDRLVPAQPRPKCPGGKFCVHAPGSVTHHAPAPFTDCPSIATAPGVGAPPSFDAELTKLEREAVPDACCYAWYVPCPGGRPLRTHDDVLLAPPALRADWSAGIQAATRDETTRARLAAYWLEQAASEHASIASFNRFALQLLALGAPSVLITATLDAARDEVRHAERCYGLAARYSGEERGPGRLELPLGSIAIDPATVAHETLCDGCLGESLAAELAGEASRSARDPAVAEVLCGIAEDEEAHAALAWRAVTWLLAEYGAPVRDAIDAFVAWLTAELEPSTAMLPCASATDGVLCADHQPRVFFCDEGYWSILSGVYLPIGLPLRFSARAAG